ncbi:hypothetical protein [Tunturibacter empetritectus]|uniref:Uncharacterized protein n=1 Tax=Tunturiibacter empetritectus TaxID=3069691 RepID=A0A7W8MU82_9BACT|nr:hypothetical protein [Edaphobacter lichenicola]MBB5319019.1 hypothetical protein [Edaphobacter lichenicola]
MSLAWKFLILLIASCQVAAAESVNISLPETNKLISFTFQTKPGGNSSFRSFQVDSAGKHFNFTARNPIARIPANPDERRALGYWIDIPGLKLNPSRYFLVGKYGTDADSHTLLFFISETEESDAAALLVIGFSTSGDPYKVLERDHLDVTSLKSTPDGAGLIVGKETLSQVMDGDGFNGSTKPYATTYDPFSVFIVHPDDKALYSLVISRSYNQKHYVWAGSHSREDYAVLYNLPAHHGVVGAPTSRVPALLAEPRNEAKP